MYFEHFSTLSNILSITVDHLLVDGWEIVWMSQLVKGCPSFLATFPIPAMAEADPSIAFLSGLLWAVPYPFSYPCPVEGIDGSFPRPTSWEMTTPVSYDTAVGTYPHSSEAFLGWTYATLPKTVDWLPVSS